MPSWLSKVWLAALCLGGFVAGGCATRDAGPVGSVATAWQNRGQLEAKPGGAQQRGPDRGPDDASPTDDTTDSIIATVDGRPISRQHWIDLLIEARGVSVLEQLIGLETAIHAANERGIVATESDIEREHDLAVRSLVDPLSSVTPKAFDREAAERLLDQVLAERGMSRDEFDIITRRNAYLRKVVESELAITETQLRGEFDRRYGERVQVRHIQLATLPEVERVRDRLATGEGFAELASRYSANTGSARAGGLLDPFSAADEQVPEAFRDAAFAIQPGQVSGAVRVGEWYHLIMVERRLPTESRNFAEVRGELEQSVRDRLVGPAMFELFEELFRQATIRIHDPNLSRAFERRHGDRDR